MNPGQLLAHFDRISDAPDAIPRLRQLILDLAVRGKLVVQDPRDEPATELLRRIQNENARLGMSGDIGTETVEPLDRIETPFKLPAGWLWTTLGEICSKTGSGSTPLGGRSAYQDHGIPFLRSQNIYNDGLRLHDVAYIDQETHRKMEGTVVKAADLLLNITGGSMGRCCRVPDDFDEANVSQHVAIIRAVIRGMQDFLHRLILSPYFQSFIFDEQTGAGRGGLPKNKMDRIPVAIPPLAEQHRIVAKVDQLMALCDRLEAAQAERESRRDRLVASSLHRLNNSADADAFRDHARFYFNHLPRLTTRTAHIQQLRQTILNLAVCGKLVAQDSNEEPASDLLKRIQAERLGAVNEGKIKKIDPVDPPNVLDFPSGLPSGWEPAYLQSLCISVTDGDHLPPPKADHGIPFLVIGDVRSQTINFKGCRYVAEEYYDALDSIRRPKKGDVLYTLVGSYGIPVMVTDDRPFCVQRHIGILRPSKNIHAGFLSRALESKRVFNQATACATGIAQKTVPLSGLRKILIPLPPLAEQQRIAAKVDELIALCDKLDAQLTITHTDSRRLLEAVLHEALAPAV